MKLAFVTIKTHRLRRLPEGFRTNETATSPVIKFSETSILMRGCHLDHQPAETVMAGEFVRLVLGTS